MSIFFNADEVFSMAMIIEENGAKFYRKAAENLTDPDINKLLLGLAKDEDAHKAIFTAMRNASKESGESVRYEAEDEQLGEYLEAYADMNIFRDDTDQASVLTGDESIQDVLRLAMNTESQSVMFYLGIRESIKDQKDKDQIEKIIKEEMNHFFSLNMHLTDIEGKLN